MLEKLRKVSFVTLLLVLAAVSMPDLFHHHETRLHSEQDCAVQLLRISLLADPGALSPHQPLSFDQTAQIAAECSFFAYQFPIHPSILSRAPPLV